MSRRTAFAFTSTSTALFPDFVLAQHAPESELEKLGKQLETIFPLWFDLQQKDRFLGHSAHEQAAIASGVVPWEREGKPMTSDDSAAFLTALGQAEKDLGWPALKREFEPRDRNMQALVDQVEQLPAKTLRDLKAKAYAAMFASVHFWDSGVDELDYDHRICRSLIEAVCAVCDIEPIEHAN